MCIGESCIENIMRVKPKLVDVLDVALVAVSAIAGKMMGPAQSQFMARARPLWNTLTIISTGSQNADSKQLFILHEV